MWGAYSLAGVERSRHGGVMQSQVETAGRCTPLRWTDVVADDLKRF